MIYNVCTDTVSKIGGLAQLVERVLSMHEVSGSIPEFSTRLLFCTTVCDGVEHASSFVHITVGTLDFTYGKIDFLVCVMCFLVELSAASFFTLYVIHHHIL